MAVLSPFLGESIMSSVSEVNVLWRLDPAELGGEVTEPTWPEEETDRPLWDSNVLGLFD